MAIDRTELAKGWAETRRYLLSHHEPAAWDRCYAPPIRGRRVRLCARCLGIYPGILLGVIAAMLFRMPVSHYVLVGLLPLPALVDWTITTVTDRAGHNVVRTLTGLLLGVGYAVGLVNVIGNGDLGVIAIGGFYAVTAGALLARVKS